VGNSLWGVGSEKLKVKSEKWEVVCGLWLVGSWGLGVGSEKLKVKSGKWFGVIV
tara:strand:+ start:237264 stop:237425 length:162 start_codon:yes stop_codon:yes gene_type:complete